MAASFQTLSSWHSQLPQSTKNKLYAGCALATVGAVTIGYYLRSNKKKNDFEVPPKSQDVLDNLDNARDNINANESRPLIKKFKFFWPVSPSRTFWGSYLLVSSTFALTFSSTFSAFVNKYIPRIMSHRFSKSFLDLLPPVPKKMSEAFVLGQYEKQLTNLEINGKDTSDLLIKATTLIGRSLDNVINPKQLHGILERILSIENEKSKLSRVRGIFSFINVVWFFSILGISATVLPVLYYIAKPVWDEIYAFFKRFFTRLGGHLRKIVTHRRAFELYELFGYFVCWYFMYLGYDAPSNIGKWMSFTGLALWVPMLAGISQYMHEPISSKAFPPMASFLGGMISLPLAYHFNSKLFGFASVIGLYSYLGFFIHGFFGGVHLGFEGDEAIGNCVIVSGLINIGLVMCKLYNVDMKKIEMFQTPLLTMSNVVGFLALLIHSTDWRWWWGRSDPTYWMRQAKMVGALVFAMFFGNYLNYPAMSNTAYTYSALYILEKSSEWRPMWTFPVAYYSIFGLSVVGWRGALYLNKNPQIITNMFKFD